MEQQAATMSRTVESAQMLVKMSFNFSFCANLNPKKPIKYAISRQPMIMENPPYFCKRCGMMVLFFCLKLRNGCIRINFPIQVGNGFAVFRTDGFQFAFQDDLAAFHHDNIVHNWL